LREESVEAGKSNSPEEINPAADNVLCRVELSEKRCCETEHCSIRVHFRDAEIEVARDSSPEALKAIFRALKEI
ncbi:hypothetical protein, partial [Agathobaculum hominis]